MITDAIKTCVTTAILSQLELGVSTLEQMSNAHGVENHKDHVQTCNAKIITKRDLIIAIVTQSIAYSATTKKLY